MTGPEQVAKAFVIAAKAHRAKQFDDNTPKMVHVVRVMLMCSPYDWDDQTVALLHDTIESGNVTSKDLVDAGFPIDIVRDVIALSKRDIEKDDYDAYISRIISTNSGRVVRTKINDLYDHLIHVPTRNIPLTDQDSADLVRYQAIWIQLNILADEKGWNTTSPVADVQ